MKNIMLDNPEQAQDKVHRQLRKNLKVRKRGSRYYLSMLLMLTI